MADGLSCQQQIMAITGALASPPLAPSASEKQVEPARSEAKALARSKTSRSVGALIVALGFDQPRHGIEIGRGAGRSRRAHAEKLAIELRWSRRSSLDPPNTS